MNHEPKDALDRAIDDALATIAAGEPRRVGAASVRKALGERHGPRIPVWFAAAAILLVAFGVWMKGRSVAPPVPFSLARSETRPESMKASVFLASSRAKPSAIKNPAEPPYEGLPRIVIATIENFEPLTTPTLDADALVIPLIDIPALSVPTLSNGPEQPQEKPQP